MDVIISNCVINLSADKDRVLAEAFRVLKPGGRLAVSDVVVRGEVPAEIRRSVELWIGCVAGALEERSTATSSPRRASRRSTWSRPGSIAWRRRGTSSTGAGLDVERIAPQVDDKFMSAFVRARKPA